MHLKAAQPGRFVAMDAVASMYAQGRGVSQNYAEAVKWWHESGEQGSAIGQANLGAMYIAGRGVPQDYVEAYFWLTLAARFGFSGASQYQEEAAGHLTPQQIAGTRKRAHDWEVTPVPVKFRE